MIHVENKADVVIVRDVDAAIEYGKRYSGYWNDIYVEPTSFISGCISRNGYAHYSQPIQGMPGYPGKKP